MPTNKSPVEGPQKHFRIAERVLVRLKLRQLRLLVAVDEHKSIQGASRQLNISQPAASKLIRDLEEDFGVELFERTNKGVLATEYGDALVRHGRLILAQLFHAAQELDDINDGSTGRVVIGTLLAASALLLPQTIANVAADKPNLTVKLVEGTNDKLMPALRTGDIDMVVGRLPTHRYRDEISQEKLYDERAVVVCRTDHPVLSRKRIALDDLLPLGWILPPPETTLRRQLDTLFREREKGVPAHVVESVSYLANREMLASSDMVGVFPDHVIDRDVSAGILATVNWKLPFDSNSVGVSFRRNKGLSPAGNLFLDELRAVANRLSG
ncbi:MAG: LysR family transcriptional regulator [Gammaproteobacteria bacterium]